MKLYLPLALFLLAVSTVAQTSGGLRSNSTTWSTANVILPIENLNSNPCLFNVDSETVINICSPSQQMNLQGSDLLGFWNYSLSVPHNNITSCDGSQSIWGTIHDFNGCHDIATQAPYYTVQGSGVNSSLAILFPVHKSSNFTRSYQLSVILTCSPYNTPTPAGFDQFGVLERVDANSETKLTTIYIRVATPNVCPQPSPNSYNLSPLQQSHLTFSNISDNTVGKLSFNLGDTPLTPNCPNSGSGDVFATYTTIKGCSTLSNNAPTYFSSNNGGLQIVFPYLYLGGEGLHGFVNVTIQLQCDASQVSVVEFDSEMSITAESGLYVDGDDRNEYFNPILKGTSPYACRITQNHQAFLAE